MNCSCCGEKVEINNDNYCYVCDNLFCKDCFQEEMETCEDCDMNVCPDCCSYNEYGDCKCDDCIG